MDLAESLKYATRVALKMSKDPEVESIAGIAAWRAYRTFDDSLGVPYKRWIARCVKLDVWCYWRKLFRHRQEQLEQADNWETYVAVWDEDPSPPVEPSDWQLLVESHLDRWPLDVIAHRHGTTVYQIRKQLAAAEARLRSVSESNTL